MGQGFPNQDHSKWTAAHFKVIFGHIVNELYLAFIEVYFGFQKIEEAIFSCQEIHNEINSRFQHMYEKVKTLADMVGSTEQCPRVCSRQKNRESCPAKTER